MVTFDPLNKFPHLSQRDIIITCGFLPPWVMHPTTIKLPIKEAMEMHYGFGPLLPIEGGEIRPDHTFSYPGDPILYPLLVIERKPGEKFVQYEHAIVAFLTEGESPFVTRMD